MLRLRRRRIVETVGCVLLALPPALLQTKEPEGFGSISTSDLPESDAAVDSTAVDPEPHGRPPARTAPADPAEAKGSDSRHTRPDWLPPVEVPARFLPGARAPETPFGDVIFESAERYGLNPELVAAIVRTESAFDPQAISAQGARGLMQLMPATAERFGLRGDEILEPASNVEAGVRYLRWLADHFDNNAPLMLAAYNAGEGTVKRHAGIPPYRETRTYVHRVYTELVGS